LAAQQVAHTRLGDAEHLGDGGLRESPGRHFLSDILSAWTDPWWRDVANGERLDNKRGSHEMFQTARHSPEIQ
jgi:hypothetical protein